MLNEISSLACLTSHIHTENKMYIFKCHVYLKRYMSKETKLRYFKSNGEKKKNYSEKNMFILEILSTRAIKTGLSIDLTRVLIR